MDYFPARGEGECRGTPTFSLLLSTIVGIIFVLGSLSA